MASFLYILGFESPRQLRNNDSHGWDDEDSQRVLIDAPDEAAALAWGREISERFLKLLFEDDRVSWRERDYGGWIEPRDESGLIWQRVAVGVFPDFGPWLREYEDEM